MEAVGELCLNIGDPVSSSVDELYSCMENESADLGGNNSRPPSLMSWTFSPITDDESYINSQDFSFVIPENPTPNGDSQNSHDQHLITDNMKTEQIEFKTEQQQPYTTQPASQFTQSVQQKVNNYSEYIYPNNITYHQSVNIHNYVGNYCTPIWWDNQSCNRTQTAYEKVPTQYLQVIEQTMDPLVGLPSHGTDFTRCSTPDYLMALNSLHHFDSPPRPNHSAAMNFPCSEETSSPQQDSGYNSDLNVSPVIQYQDAIKLRRHTSTPNTYPVMTNAKSTSATSSSQLPVFHMANAKPASVASTNQLQVFHTANAKQTSAVNTSQLPVLPMPNAKQTSVTSTGQLPVFHMANTKQTSAVNTSQLPTLSDMPNYKPKVSMCPDYMKPEQIKEQIYKALHNKVSRPGMNPINNQMCNKNTIMTVADYEKTKKIKPKSSTCTTTTVQNVSTKRKADCDLKLDSKRRRHNEPLNQTALDVMAEWYDRHSENPYPNKAEKDQLSKDGGITLAQVKSWFANKRNRSNNTRPKKQKMEMEGRLMEICHQLARDASKPNKDNAYYIQQLSSILHT